MSYRIGPWSGKDTATSTASGVDLTKFYDGRTFSAGCFTVKNNGPNQLDISWDAGGHYHNTIPSGGTLDLGRFTGLNIRTIHVKATGGTAVYEWICSTGEDIKD